MSRYHVEKEYKILINKEEFTRLVNNIEFDSIIKQTNHYYSAKDNMGMRIREIDNKFTFTLKHFINNEVREYEFAIKDNDINDPKIKAVLNELAIEDPKYLGDLKTVRYLKKYPKGELCIDESAYLGIKDHEIEYELYDAKKDDIKTFKTFLQNHGIAFHISDVSKYTRFLKRRSAMKTLIFCAQGHEECEALIVYDLLKRAKMEVELVSISDDLLVTSSHGLTYQTDRLFKDVDFSEVQALVLPGGLPGTDNLYAFKPLIAKLHEFYEAKKLIAAICAAPSIFIKEGFVSDEEFVCFPGFECSKKPKTGKVAIKDNVITAKGLGADFEFAHAIIAYLKDKETADAVLKQIQYQE